MNEQDVIRFIAVGGGTYKGSVKYRETEEKVRVRLDRKYGTGRSVFIDNDGNLYVRSCEKTSALSVHPEDIPRFKLACQNVPKRERKGPANCVRQNGKVVGAILPNEAAA